MRRLPSIAVMQRAFSRKDASFDGIFFVGVKTTGVFCRPVCRAKPAREENIEFFSTAMEALKSGYRPCKLCHPIDAGGVPEIVQQMKSLAERTPARVTQRDLLERGISPVTANRQFRLFMGMTFARWQRLRRVGQAVTAVKNGATMNTALATSGFESRSGFREALARLVDTKPNGATGTTILHADWLNSPLGAMLAVCNDDGIVMLDFAEKSGFERAVERLRGRIGRCAVVPGEHRFLTQLQLQLQEYFASVRRVFTVPLAPHGTDFERRVWKFLQTIPFGETRTYGEQARAIGSAAAVRAVGAANGRNDISILIPCHRVIGANGSLVGYGGGLERKKWLLDHEQRVLGAQLF